MDDNDRIIEVSDKYPLPQGDGVTKYPWAVLEVGDSFFVPGIGNGSSLGSSRATASRKYGHTYTIRKVEGGIRVWRVT